MISYPNITKHGGFSWKHKLTGKLAHLSRMWKGCRVFLRHFFMILCVHFFNAYQARTYMAKSGAINMNWHIFMVIKSNFCWSRMCIKFSGDDCNTSMIMSDQTIIWTASFLIVKLFKADTCSFTAHLIRIRLSWRHTFTETKNCTLKCWKWYYLIVINEYCCKVDWGQDICALVLAI